MARGKPATTPKTTTIRARIDAKLKIQAEKVLEKLGLNASEAIRLSYKEVVHQRALPFDVLVPNAETTRALKDADAGKNLTRYETFDDFKKATIKA
jgi:DNA-damage-inducible protein J